MTEFTESGAVVTPVAGNAEPLKVQFDFLRRLLKKSLWVWTMSQFEQVNKEEKRQT